MYVDDNYNSNHIILLRHTYLTAIYQQKKIKGLETFNLFYRFRGS